MNKQLTNNIVHVNNNIYYYYNILYKMYNLFKINKKVKINQEIHDYMQKLIYLDTHKILNNDLSEKSIRYYNQIVA